MIKLSRRALARYAADQLLAGKSAHSLARWLAASLLEAGLANQIEFFMEDLRHELETRRQLVTAQIISAQPLTDQLRRQLISQLKKVTAVAEFDIHEVIDKAVIGGFRLQTADRVWDTTIKRQLVNLRENANG